MADNKKPWEQDYSDNADNKKPWEQDYSDNTEDLSKYKKANEFEALGKGFTSSALIGQAPLVAGIGGAIGHALSKSSTDQIEELLKNVPDKYKDLYRTKLLEQQSKLNEPKGYGQAFEEGRKAEIRDQAKMAKDHPVWHFGGELGGALVGVPMLKGLNLGKYGNIGLGVGLGAEAGLVNTEDMTSNEVLKNAALGAATGGAMGASQLAPKSYQRIAGSALAGTIPNAYEAISEGKPSDYLSLNTLAGAAMGGIPVGAIEGLNAYSAKNKAFKTGSKGVPLTKVEGDAINAKDFDRFQTKAMDAALEPISKDINAENQRILDLQKKAGVEQIDVKNAQKNIEQEIAKHKQFQKEEAQNLNNQLEVELDQKRQALYDAENILVNKRNAETLANHNQKLQEFVEAQENIKKFKEQQKQIQSQIDLELEQSQKLVKQQLEEQQASLELENKRNKEIKEQQLSEHKDDIKLKKEQISELSEKLGIEYDVKSKSNKEKSELERKKLNVEAGPELAQAIENIHNGFEKSYENIKESVSNVELETGKRFEFGTKDAINELVSEISNSKGVAPGEAKAVENMLKSFKSETKTTLNDYQLLKEALQQVEVKIRNDNGVVSETAKKALKKAKENLLRNYESALNDFTKSLPSNHKSKDLGSQLQELNKQYSKYIEVQEKGVQRVEKSSLSEKDKPLVFKAEQANQLVNNLLKMEPNVRAQAIELLEHREPGLGKKIFDKITQYEQRKANIESELPKRSDYIEQHPEMIDLVNQLKQQGVNVKELEFLLKKQNPNQEEINRIESLLDIYKKGLASPINLSDVNRINENRIKLSDINKQLGISESVEKPKPYKLESVDEKAIDKSLSVDKKVKVKPEDIDSIKAQQLQEILTALKENKAKSKGKRLESEIPYELKDITKAVSEINSKFPGERPHDVKVKHDAIEKYVKDNYGQEVWDRINKAEIDKINESSIIKKATGLEEKSVSPTEVISSGLGSHIGQASITSKALQKINPFSAKNMYEKGASIRKKLSASETNSHMAKNLTEGSPAELQRIAEIMDSNVETKNFAKIIEKMQNMSNTRKAAFTFDLMQDKLFRQAYKNAMGLEEEEKK